MRLLVEGAPVAAISLCVPLMGCDSELSCGMNMVSVTGSLTACNL